VTLISGVFRAALSCRFTGGLTFAIVPVVMDQTMYMLDQGPLLGVLEMHVGMTTTFHCCQLAHPDSQRTQTHFEHFESLPIV
jgi:hypothetical protein